MIKIAFSGKMGSGKSFCADYVSKKIYAERLFFASPLKMILKEVYGMENKTDIHKPTGMTYRQIIQKLSDNMKLIYNNVFTDYMQRQIQRINEHIVIDDMRFYHEYEMLKNEGFTIINIFSSDLNRDIRLSERDNYVPSKEEKTHNSEVLQLPYDYAVYNNGTSAELYYNLDVILSQLKGQ